MKPILMNALVSSIDLRRETVSIAEPNNGELGRVRRAAEKLKPLEREVLAMSAGRGLLVGDIALQLGIGERRVERLLARALYKFDWALEREGWPWWHFW